MPSVILSSHLSTHANGSSFELPGTTVRELLESLFQLRPGLRSYLLDDQGVLRHHVAAFVNDQPVADKASLAVAVRPSDKLFLFQALSGG